MKKIQITKGKLIIGVIAIAVIIAAVYFLYPRELGDIVGCPNSVAEISITQYRSSYSSDDIATLTGEDAAEFINIIKSTKVHLNPFFKKSDEGGVDTIGMDIKMRPLNKAAKAPLKIQVFTDNIVVIDGFQYNLYGSEFIETFRKYIS